jgi:hypothetical protein
MVYYDNEGVFRQGEAQSVPCRRGCSSEGRHGATMTMGRQEGMSPPRAARHCPNTCFGRRVSFVGARAEGQQTGWGRVKNFAVGVSATADKRQCRGCRRGQPRTISKLVPWEAGRAIGGGASRAFRASEQK